MKLYGAVVDTYADSRRCTDMKFYAAVVNTYGKVGQEFEDFAAVTVVESNSRGRGRGRTHVSLTAANNVFSHVKQVVG